jgi:hypothetical protein
MDFDNTNAMRTPLPQENRDKTRDPALSLSRKKLFLNKTRLRSRTDYVREEKLELMI